jgi:hypothetical protein
MNRFHVDEYRRLAGYTYEPETETPQVRPQPVRQVPQQAPRQVVEQVSRPQRMSVRQEIRELKGRIATLEQRVEVVQEDVRVVQRDQHGLKSLIEEARGQVRTVYVPQEPRFVYRDRPTPSPRATAPAAAQMEAAIHRAPTPPAAPAKSEPKGSRWTYLEVD